MKPCAFTFFISFSVIVGLPHAVSLGVPPEFASSWLPRFQPGIKFCENLTESPFVSSGAGSVFFVVVVAGFAVVVSGFFVAVVVVATVSGFVVVVVVVVVVTVVVSALVVVVSALVVAVVVVSALVVAGTEVVVVAVLLSTDEFAPPEHAEIPVTTIMPLIRAASILFFIDTFLSSAFRFSGNKKSFCCFNHIVMVFTRKVNSISGLSRNFVKTITQLFQR